MECSSRRISTVLPLKSQRWPISLSAWWMALSTSCRSTFETMSKEFSDATKTSGSAGKAVMLALRFAALQERDARAGSRPRLLHRHPRWRREAEEPLVQGRHETDRLEPVGHPPAERVVDDDGDREPAGIGLDAH